MYMYYRSSAKQFFHAEATWVRVWKHCWLVPEGKQANLQYTLYIYIVWLMWYYWKVFINEHFWEDHELRSGVRKLINQYSGYLIIWIPIIPIFDYLSTWTSPCLRQQWEKDVPVTGVLPQEKAKLLYEQLFPDATMPFSASMRFRSQFTTSELAEQHLEHCSTLYYCVAN